MTRDLLAQGPVLFGFLTASGRGHSLGREPLLCLASWVAVELQDKRRLDRRRERGGDGEYARYEGMGGGYTAKGRDFLEAGQRGEGS